jgi:hypothetical protein
LPLAGGKIGQMEQNSAGRTALRAINFFSRILAQSISGCNDGAILY